MSYVIANNYSPLNSYNYHNKPAWSSALDWLSTPCRRALGGRNIYLAAQTYEDKMSTAGRITTLFFSILIFPIALVSATSFALKLATLPWVWEKKTVKEQSRQTWKTIEQFNAAFDQRNYDQALDKLRKRPGLEARIDINKKLFKIINVKINEGEPWHAIKKLLPLLSSQDAIALINHAVKTRLSSESASNKLTLDGSMLIGLVEGSLAATGFKSVEACYMRLLTDALRIDVNNDLILNTIKMDLADSIIKKITHLRIANAKDEIGRILAGTQETTTRYKIFDTEQKYYHLYLMFNNKESMQQIHNELQAIRAMRHLESETTTALKGHISKGSGVQTKWNLLSEEMKSYHDKAVALNQSARPCDQQYLQKMLQIDNDSVSCISKCLQATTVEEIESYVGVAQSSIADLPKDLEEMLKEESPSLFKSDLENLLITLRLKRTEAMVVMGSGVRNCLLKEALMPFLTEWQKNALSESSSQ